MHKVENEDSDASNGEVKEFGTFHALCAVDVLKSGIQTFDHELADHPLVTNSPLLTKLNVEGIWHMTAEIDTAASHNIISKAKFDTLQGKYEYARKKYICNV